jgi:3-hydroxybutyryl-CoA dehydrogenase
MDTIETVAVVGATESGSACAVLAALAGCAVRVHDPSPEALDRAFAAVRDRVELAFAAGAITPGERQRILDGVLFTPDLEEAATAADLVVHAGAASGPGCARLAGLLRATTAVAASGGADAALLAGGLPQPGRVIAISLEETHGPVPRLEIAPGPSTVGHVLDRAWAFAARVNRASRVSLRGGRGA